MISGHGRLAGFLPARLTGRMMWAWLKKQHAKWLHEMEEHGTLATYGEQKKSTEEHH